MPTFLTTAKMNPELAARVERSVTGRDGRGSKLIVRRIVSIARIGLVLGVVLAIYGYVQARKNAKNELEKSRTELIDKVATEGAAITPEQRTIAMRTETWLKSLAAPYDRDLIEPEMRTPASTPNSNSGSALPAMLAVRSSIYVRGPLEAFQSSSTRMAEAASQSTKDSLLLCLVEPPSARTEKVLIDKVRFAYLAGQPLEARTPNVHRFNDAIVGLPLLRPEWTDRVRKAQDDVELARLRADLDKFPIERTKKAAQSDLLVMVIDEPTETKSPTELDGERPHLIRLGVVDLAQDKLLLRVRIAVDPSWITPARRPTYATGLDACAFAFDVDERIKSPAK